MTITGADSDRPHLPGSALDASRMPGHWLLARMGKTVLRPGGVAMSRQLLDGLRIGSEDDVVEIAPGLGSTTRMVLASNPATYTGVDRDPDAAVLLGDLLRSQNRRIVHASAQATGIAAASADVVFGEAYLTMQPQSVKQKILDEVCRILRPDGRFALHEIALSDDITTGDREKTVSDLTSTIKVGVSPLTSATWDDLLTDHGLVIRQRVRLPLHLLEPRRLLADEGVTGTARFVTNVLCDRDARTRVRAMRSAMRANARHLSAYGIVAVRSDGSWS